VSRIENAEFHAARNECDLVLANDSRKYLRTAPAVYLRPSALFARMGREREKEFYARYSKPLPFFFSTVTFLVPLIAWAIQEYGRSYADEYHFLHLPSSLGSFARNPVVSNVLDILVPSCLILAIDIVVFWLVSLTTFTLTRASLRSAFPTLRRISDRLSYVTAANSLVMAPIFFGVLLFQTRTPSQALRLSPFTDVLIAGLLLNAFRGLSHCVLSPSGAKWTRRLSSCLAILMALASLVVCYSVLEKTGLFRSPVREATIIDNERFVMANMWQLKNSLIETSNQTGVPPPAAIEARFGVGGETYDYVFRVIPREFGEFSIVGVSEKYGDAGSGRRSFFLDCVGGVIRGVDPEHQESVHTSIVSSESPSVASENDYFRPLPAHMNQEPVSVLLVRGRRSFAHDEELSFFASTLVRRVAYEADMAVRTCIRSGSLPPQAIMEMKARVRQLAHLATEDLTRLHLASKNAGFRRESDFTKLKANVDSKVNEVDNSCATPD
jgi:hypothetical protein